VIASTDAVVTTTLVAIDARTAFSVFTDEVDLWWRREPRFRTGARPGVMRFEPGAGGRLLEVCDGAEVELARVTAWEPPRRLVVAWRGTTRVLGAATEVEVRFDPEGEATRVTIEHRGWDAVPAKHPARIGLMGGAFSSLVGGWWAELVTSLRHRAVPRPVA
jgi:uncharacterized protein YndB with AHSA1/START domain